jgi:3-oxoacyl-[acyl-carrier protein] reductase
MYATTKTANEAMARCYANAFGGKKPEFDFMDGTTANSIFTGLTATSGPQQFGQKVFDEFQDYWIPRQAMPRLGQPEDIADIVGLLCSKEARWITGSKVSANGGSITIL